MKWFKTISIVIGALIVISIITNVVINNILNDRITVAHESGSQEGHAQGYVVGYQEGERDGYQEGSKVGYQEGSKVGYQEGSTAGFEKSKEEKEEGYNNGYKAGFKEGIGTGYLVRNPTYNEVQEMLAEDKTASAGGINNNAEDKGIRAAYVWVSLLDGWGYILVAFETVDRGLILVEPWSHQEVKLEISKRYSELNGFPTPDYDDTIIKITIIW